MMLRAWLAALLWLVSSFDGARAQPAQAMSAAPLTLQEVLRSSARAAPQIIEQLARVRQAEGRALTADGAFDTVFDLDGRSRVLGFYDGTVLDARISRPFTGNGGYTYGSYRVSRGDFPIYEDQNFTNRLGELKVGALYALLRDRLIDERRTRRTLAAGDIDIARFEASAVSIGVQRRAIEAYQNWVASGLRLRAYRDLLALAESRRGAISRQVELGARPQILLTENDQNLVRRRALVVRAEQGFDAAANALSLYYRDASGERVIVDPRRLPSDAAALLTVRTAVALQDLESRRPDLQMLLARVDQSAARLALARNELRPRLDLRGEVSKDVGSEGQGGSSRTPLEAIVGFRFSVPLQNRAAKGRVAEAKAEIDALTARARLIRDQIATEVEGINIAVGGAERLAAAAEQERILADRLAEAERRRFSLGSSDFFLVNQREETATDAQVRMIDAQARTAAARAELAAALADEEALGLDLVD
jgi:outer membrane protein TolC